MPVKKQSLLRERLKIDIATGGKAGGWERFKMRESTLSLQQLREYHASVTPSLSHSASLSLYLQLCLPAVCLSLSPSLSSLLAPHELRVLLDRGVQVHTSNG